MEATLLCIDNGEWSRNGDFGERTRYDAQAEVVNLLSGQKTGANPENTVGIITMAGRSPQVIVTPTTELGRIVKALTGVVVEGHAKIGSSLQIAQLALKHRQNKGQRQRIVLFIASPVHETEKELITIAKKLKKNNVAVDIVSFGSEDLDANSAKLKAFHEAVDGSNSSAFVSVVAGTNLVDALIATSIFQGEGGGTGAPTGDGGASTEFQFGVDPNVDPELAMALQVSLEEERARQSRAAQEAGDGATPVKQEDGSAPGAGGNAEAATEVAMGDDHDELIQQALAMSMASGGPEAAGGTGARGGASADGGGAGQGLDEEDQDLLLALKISAEGQGQGADGAAIADAAAALPDVDMESSEVQEAKKKLDGDKDKDGQQ